MNEKPEALRLAQEFELHVAFGSGMTIRRTEIEAVAAELRRLHAENERLQFERDALLKTLRRQVRCAEWADKHIHRGEEEEAFQNWVLEVRLPVPLSEPDKSPEAAFQRFVAATLRREDV